MASTTLDDIRHIIKKTGQNPIFKVEFRINENDDIVMDISSESTSDAQIYHSEGLFSKFYKQKYQIVYNYL